MTEELLVVTVGRADKQAQNEEQRRDRLNALIEFALGAENTMNFVGWPVLHDSCKPSNSERADTSASAKRKR
jgi:hypothetical protein